MNLTAYSKKIRSGTISSPIEKYSTEQFVKKKRVSYITVKFFFLDGKTLQRQNVSATKRLDTKSFRRQNFNTKESKIRAKKKAVIHTTMKILKKKIIFATLISIEQCFHWKAFGRMNTFPIGDSPVPT